MRAGRRQGRRITIGALLLLGLAALGLLIFFLDDLKYALRDDYHVLALFPEAPRLRAGAEVWLAGHAVGRVVEVNMLPPAGDTTARVLAVLELPTEIRAQIRRDSRVRLTAPRLIAEPVVDVIPGSPSAPLLPPGDTLHAARKIVLAEVVASGRRAGAALDTMLASARELGHRIEERAPALRRTGAALAGVQAEFAALSVSLERGGGIAALRDSTWKASLARAGERLEELEAALQDAQERFDGDSASLRAAFAGLQRRVARLQQQVVRLQTALRAPVGLVGRMAADSAFQKALNGARAQLDSLVLETKQNPRRFFF
ncbi:MAG: MCE family protein [Gemmatimonadetes bacterium]|nr:MCE family protein [Gemmatimonadota bacterium]